MSPARYRWKAMALTVGWLMGASVLQGAPPSFQHGDKASVLIFTTTDCPVANAMQPEIARLHDEFRGKGVAFTLVHVDPDTTAAKAKEHATAYSITVPYVLDPTHALVKRYGATRTPEAYVIRPDGSVAYHGRINDLFHAPGQRRRSPTTHDLREAITAILAGKHVAVETQPAVGCVIADFAKASE